MADGGFEEFCELVRSCASRSATRTFNAAFSNRRVLSSARISTISSTNSTYVGCGIPQLSHSHQPLFRETPTLNPNNPANVGWNSFTCRADQLHLTSYAKSSAGSYLVSRFTIPRRKFSARLKSGGII